MNCISNQDTNLKMALLAYLLQNQKTKVKICYYIFLYHLYIFCTNDNALKIKKIPSKTHIPSFDYFE